MNKNIKLKVQLYVSSTNKYKWVDSLYENIIDKHGQNSIPIINYIL